MPSCGLISSPHLSVSGISLRQWRYKYVGNVTSFVSMKEKVNIQKNFVAHARPRGNGNRSLSAVDDWCHDEK